MLILGIESSCDETAAALVEIKNEKIKIISNVVSSQIKIHQQYGGVVPEIAARCHIEKILPVIIEALGGNEKKKIDCIAVTIGPGLITSLLVGIETARTLAYLWNKPIIGVNHLEGHIVSVLLNQNKGISNFKSQISKQTQNVKLKIQKNIFPAMALLVSGGHTELILIKDILKYKKIGQTRDDAAGEAFDKVAKLLNLDYPGGPIIAANAAIKIKNQKSKIKNDYFLNNKIKFPRPMINSNDFDFSFSGLKTAVFYQLKKDVDWNKKIPEYCYEFQQAVVDVLTHKTFKAIEKYKVKTFFLSGGVAANQELRKQFELKSKKCKIKFFVPPKNFCTDNAAMIAVAGYFNALAKKYTPWQKLKPDSNLELGV
ncbi:MAG: tRNA (adenosine(37)-N6)-threonylcarbamoyltransferase complex transferase subunit TsaD [Patescibacteria group bacterium]